MIAEEEMGWGDISEAAIEWWNELTLLDGRKMLVVEG